MANVIFLGTDARAISVLKKLLEKHNVVGIITQPDKIRGTNKKPTPTFIAEFANKQRISLLKPDSLNTQTVNWIKDKNPDVIVTAYFAQLIPPELLNLTPAGVLVIHPSLLPRWRWGSPVQATLAVGDKETGVTIMRMDEKFDHGPIIAQSKEAVLDSDIQDTLYIRLFEKGAELLVDILDNYIAGTIQPIEQDHNRATFARHLKKEHGQIKGEHLLSAINGQTGNGMIIVPFALDADKDPIALPPTPSNILNYIKAVLPWPGAFTNITIKSKLFKLKILEAHLNNGKLILEKVQLEGKKPVSWKQFNEGYSEFEF